MINELVLEQKLQALARYPLLDAAVINQFGAVVRGLDDWSLFRINPLRFATDHQLGPAAAIDLFVHGAKVGLFDFAYHMVCPGCGGVEHSHHALDQIEPDMFHCTSCNMDVKSDLDDQVQVTFTLNPAVGTLQIDPYEGRETYGRYFFSQDLTPSSTMQEYLGANFRGFMAIEPDDNSKITFQAEPEAVYRLSSLEIHAALYIFTSAEKAALPQIVDVELLPNGFSPTDLKIPAGEITLHIHNRTKAKCGMALFRVDLERIMQIIQATPHTRHPALTGKMLLNNQSFRDLFRIHSLAADLRLNVRSLTILFTDLKDSTEMYGRAGDALAYSLVQRHFDLLTRIVRQYSGSIVKTMGDSVMATFSNPQDGVRAALDMVLHMEQLQSLFRQEGYEAGIKIGLNEGAALAVNADERLDYFGQSVNVAARVRGLAEAGEIWLTDTIYDSYEVEDILRTQGYQAYKQSALLKGVSEPTIVYQCTHL
jgi:class 3 adenylate cyclase